MKKIYYKVRLSYDNEAENPTITEEELPRVLWAFANKTDVIIPQGAFRGKDIISILPDYGACLGYNRGAKLNGEDFGDYRKSFGNLPEKKLEELKGVLRGATSEDLFIEKSKQLLLN